jgi:hypothetical protein
MNTESIPSNPIVADYRRAATVLRRFSSFRLPCLNFGQIDLDYYDADQTMKLQTLTTCVNCFVG